MTTLDDLDLFDQPTPPVTTGRVRCLHPRRFRLMVDGGTSCTRCGKEIADAASRKSRNNRARGNREELVVAKQLDGGRKVGPLGFPWDVETGNMRLQVKKVARMPSMNEIFGYMDQIPVSNRIRGVALIQPGRGGRRTLVVDLDEYAEWYSDPTAEVTDGS